MKIAIIAPDNRDELRRYNDPHPYFGTAPTALLEGLANRKDCEIHIACCTQQEASAPKRLAENIYFHSTIVPKIGWMRGGYIGCVQGIRRLLHRIQPDIVHGQGTERYCALAAVYSGHRNVLTLHGNMRQIARVNRARPFSFLWLAARLERLALPRTNGVICISSHTQRNVADLAPKTWIVPNAIAADFFTIPRKPIAPKTVICVANIALLKNQIRLIEALDPLATSEPFRLIFYGAVIKNDPYSAGFMRAVQARSWCEYRGFAERAALREALGSAALLALPSLEENCPMAVVEAKAAGVPVAATRAGGTPDLIEHGVEGLLFNPGDAESIRSTIQTLLQNEPKATQYAIRAKERAMRENHPDRVAARHMEIYREIAGSNTIA